MKAYIVCKLQSILSSKCDCIQLHNIQLYTRKKAFENMEISKVCKSIHLEMYPILKAYKSMRIRDIELIRHKMERTKTHF